ncbi:hypothetical protein [Phaffia rhodozyma]|uniref:Uncharacterized protein n=1 Tax=Phaffia rhodozyma TaxID=264483 RepID=A0A0F7SKC0_PHARH|nr:hypothetical protein [Phaffia rhodozyma]
MEPTDSHDTRSANYHFQSSIPYSVPSNPSTSMADREEAIRSAPWDPPDPYTSDSSANNSIAVQPTAPLYPAFLPSSVAAAGRFPESFRSVPYAGSANEFDPSKIYTYSIPFIGHPGQQPPTGGYHHMENELSRPDEPDEPSPLQIAPVQDTKVSANFLEVIQPSGLEQTDLGFESNFLAEPTLQVPSYPEKSTDSVDSTHYRHREANSLYANIPTPHHTEYSLAPHPQTHPVPSYPTSYHPNQPAGISINYPTIVETEAGMPLGPRPEVIEHGENTSEGWELNSSFQPPASSLTVGRHEFYTGSTLLPSDSSGSIYPTIHQNPSSAIHLSPGQQYYQFLQPSLQQQHQIPMHKATPVLHNALPSPSTSSSSKPSQSFVYPDQEHNSIPNASSAYSFLESRSRSISHSNPSSSPPSHNTPSSTLQFPILAPAGQPVSYLADSEPSSAQSLTFADQPIDPIKSTTLPLEFLKGNPKQGATSKKKKRTVHPNPPLASCSICQKSLMRLLMRGTTEDWETDWFGWWVCRECSESQMDDTSQIEVYSGATRSGMVSQDSFNSVLGPEKAKRRDRPIGSVFGQIISGSLSNGTRAGGVGRRKRTRETMNTEAPLVCDVCFRFKGQGGIVPKDGRSELKFSVEFVCISCEEKYRRCTDCGSGGGARIGIGKWRSKELFINNRKTCSLSHVRIGSAPMKVGTWDVKDFENDHVWVELLDLCEALWKDRLLSRMAVPDVLEANLGDLNDRPRTFADVQATLDAGWPSRQPLIDARQKMMSPQLSSELSRTVNYGDNRIDTRSGQRFRKYLGLTWCKCKPRRSGLVSTFTNGGHGDSGLGGSSGSGDEALEIVKEGKQSGEESGEGLIGHESINNIIPPGYELVGLYIGDWNVDDGTLLITTSLPFEGSDSEDRTSLTVGEMILRIVTEIEETNAALTAHGQTQGEEQVGRKAPSLEHIWCISDGMTSQIRDKMHESLTRKRQFLPLDEYLALHRTVRPEIFHELPYSLPGPWVDGVGIPGTIMVRWLGPHFDREQLEEYSDIEKLCATREFDTSQSIGKNDIGKKSIKARVIKG